MIKILVIFAILTCNKVPKDVTSRKSLQTKTLKDGYYKIILNKDDQKKFIKNYFKALLEKNNIEFNLYNLKEYCFDEEVVEDFKEFNKFEELQKISSLNELINLIEIVKLEETKRKNKTFLEVFEMGYILKIEKGKIYYAQEELITSNENTNKDPWILLGELEKDKKNLKVREDLLGDSLIPSLTKFNTKFKDSTFYLYGIPLELKEIALKK